MNDKLKEQMDKKIEVILLAYDGIKKYGDLLKKEDIIEILKIDKVVYKYLPKKFQNDKDIQLAFIK